MTAQPDETTGPTPPRPPYAVQVLDGGPVLVGSVVYGADREAARRRAEDARQMHPAGSWECSAAEAVLDFLFAAERHAAYADNAAAFPEQAPAPAPTAPPVELRLIVDVARVERCEVLVRVPPAVLADDPEGALADATRALHDAAAAAARVLVVEPAHRDQP